MTIISNTSDKSSVQSDIKEILYQSGKLRERSIFLREQSVIKTAHLQELIKQSLLLLEESKRLCVGKPVACNRGMI